MAEREGFEPPVPFQARRFSRPEPSTTRPPLRRYINCTTDVPSATRPKGRDRWRRGSSLAERKAQAQSYENNSRQPLLEACDAWHTPDGVSEASAGVCNGKVYDGAAKVEPEPENEDLKKTGPRLGSVNCGRKAMKNKATLGL